MSSLDNITPYHHLLWTPDLGPSSRSIFQNSIECIPSQYYDQYQQQLTHVLDQTKQFIHQLYQDLYIVSDGQSSMSLILPPKLLPTVINSLDETLFHDTSKYLDRLSHRLLDPHCRILVTGDVNVGKSTFLNALFREHIFPTDQQPCTCTFCELFIINSTEKETIVHAIPHLDDYNPTNPITFDSITLPELNIIMKMELCPYVWFKIQVPFHTFDQIPLTFIDSPGLNHDRIQTTALFAKQQDIDVILLLIHAANHLTLSSIEFLQSASKEKQFIFIIVNKMDEITHPEHCKRLILQQISQILPHTFDSANELVHFLSSKDQLDGKSTLWSTEAFHHFQQSLKRFVYEHRIRSKLLPIKTFIQNLLSEYSILISNIISITESNIRDIDKLLSIHPSIDRLESIKEHLVQSLDEQCDKCIDDIWKYCQKKLKDFEDNIRIHVPWPGLFKYNSYLIEVNSYVNQKIQDQLKECQSFAIDSCTKCSKRLSDIAFNHAPEVFTVIDIGTIEFEPCAVYTLSIWSFIPSWKEISSYWFRKATQSGLFISGIQLFNVLYQGTEIKSRIRELVPLKAMIVVTGVVIFTRLISDIRSLFIDKSCTLLQSYLSRDQWSQRQTMNIIQTSRRYLKKPSWHYQHMLHQKLFDHQRIHNENALLRTRLLGQFNDFASHQNTLQTLKKRIESIFIE